MTVAFGYVMQRSAKSGLLLPLGVDSPPAPWNWTMAGAGNTPALIIDGSFGNPVVIDGENIKQTGQLQPCIRIDAVRDVEVKNCRLQHQWRAITATVPGGTFKQSNNTYKGVNPDVNGQMQHWHVNVWAPVQEHKGLSMWGGGGGVYVNGVDQNANTFKFQNNLGRNMICVKSNGTGLPGRAGYQVELDHNNYAWGGHFLQLNGTTAAGALVENNFFQNNPSDPANPELLDWGALNSDVFNFYRSGGVAGNPIKVRYNYAEGSFSSRWWEIESAGTAFIMDHARENGAGDAAKLKYVDFEDNFSTRIQNIDYVIWGYADHINIKRARMAETLQLRGINLWLPGTRGRELIYGDDLRTNCTIQDNFRAWERAPGYYTVIAGLPGGGGNSNINNGPPQGYGTVADEDNIKVLWEAERIAQLLPVPGSTIPIW